MAVTLLADRAALDRTAVVLGCDPALTTLGAHLGRRHARGGLRLAIGQATSLRALGALARGEATAGGSPRLTGQLRQLRMQLDSVSVDVRVALTSDNSTRVSVARVGETAKASTSSAVEKMSRSSAIDQPSSAR